MIRRKTAQIKESQIDSVGGEQADHSGGEITDYEDDIRGHTEDEDETHHVEDYRPENASFLLMLSQNGNESLVMDDKYEGNSETCIEKEINETSERKRKEEEKKQSLKAVKDSAVGG